MPTVVAQLEDIAWTVVYKNLFLLFSPALGESQICYILDGILFLYGIILTVLYCRLKVQLPFCPSFSQSPSFPMVPVTGSGTEKPPVRNAL
uniref:Uncharacterized protein n=1 Tax=Oncorhynchus mykiss TaxID=8022 RepID=A0A8C7LVQ6_ONCMY